MREEAGSARGLGKGVSGDGANAGWRGERMDGGQGWMGPTSRSSHSWERRRETQEITNTDKKGKWKRRAHTARNEAKVGSDENLEVVVEMKIKREEGNWLAEGNFQIWGSIRRGIAFSDTEKGQCRAVRDLGSLPSPRLSSPQHSKAVDASPERVAAVRTSTFPRSAK